MAAFTINIRPDLVSESIELSDRGSLRFLLLPGDRVR
jgi:hypothetical protein